MHLSQFRGILAFTSRLFISSTFGVHVTCAVGTHTDIETIFSSSGLSVFGSDFVLLLYHASIWCFVGFRAVPVFPVQYDRAGFNSFCASRRTLSRLIVVHIIS